MWTRVSYIIVRSRFDADERTDALMACRKTQSLGTRALINDTVTSSHSANGKKKKKKRHELAALSMRLDRDDR
jgi:hypothetical protein